MGVRVGGIGVRAGLRVGVRVGVGLGAGLKVCGRQRGRRHPDNGVLLLQPHVRPVAAEELPVEPQRLDT